MTGPTRPTAQQPTAHRIEWLDLLSEGDHHPRRFDSPVTLRAYLLKMERLSEEAADELLREGRVSPPLTRRAYRIRPLGS